MKILILGSNGQVGWELQRSLAPIGTLLSCDRRVANLDAPESLRAIVRDYCPQVIVNAAAYTAVDKAETDEAAARRINTDAVAVLAEEAKSTDAWLVHYSTDYVFDGTSPGRYQEDDATNPLSVYGETKLAGEQAIREQTGNHFIFRTSWVYADRGNNFVKTMLRLACERDELSVVYDQIGAPTHAALIADVTAHVLHQTLSGRAVSQRALSGTYHLAAAGETNWHAYACYAIEQASKLGMNLKLTPDSVKAIPSEAYKATATRPKNSRLNCGKIEKSFNLTMPHWEQQVKHTIQALAERIN